MPDDQVNPVQIQKFLGGVDYPVSKEDLVDTARSNNAPDDVLKMLEDLPDNTEFQTPADVNKALGQER